jgi:murein DD-endopeptidase MepM/ murein hydrolase activator NlpD
VAFNFMGNVKTLTSSVTSLKKELSGVYDVLKKIKGLGPSAFGDVNAVLSKSGQFGNGQGTPVFAKTPVNGAPKFSSATPMAAAKPGSNAQQSQYEKTAMAIQTQYLDMGIRQARFAQTAGVVGAVTSVAGGLAGMLPETGQVAKRAGIYYGASAMFGGTNRVANQRATFNAMRGGITSDMGDAEAFSALTSFSFMPGSKNMAQGLGEVSAAAKALGMDNADAASAVGAMSTGSMGAQLYQYGIRQYDDEGNLRKSGDISKDILQRIFYPGQDVSKIGAEQFAKDSMGMNLDYQLATMGITGATATRMKAEMGLAVTGKNPNLESVDTSSSPLKPFLDIQDSETKLVQKHEADILEGARKAAKALKELNEFLEKTPPLVVQLNAALQTVTGTKEGSNLKNAIVAGVTGVTSAVAATKVKNYLKNLKAGTTPGADLADDAAKVAANTGKTVIDPVTGAAVKDWQVASNASKLSKFTTAAGKFLGPVAIYTMGKQLLSETKNGWDSSKAPDPNQGFWSSLFMGTKYVDKSTLPPEVRPAPGSFHRKVQDFFRWSPFKDDKKVDGGPTAGFFSKVGSSSSGVNSFAFNTGATPMAGGAVASSMSATSISKVIGAGFGAKDPSLTMAGALNYHTGQDTPMEVGTPVHARFAGKVVERNLSRDLGIAVEVDHGDGYSSIYGHLNLKSVRAGQDVKVGDLIGKSGATGRVRGPHLHFELRKGKVPTDPKGYTAGNPGGSADSGSTGGASKVILGTGSEKEWAAGLLGKLGAPVTDSSVNALTTWMRHEGGHWKNSAHYNPLNTTLDVSNNESMNSVGVKRYKSWDEGYAATVNTLTGKSADARGYTAIVNALKTGASTSDILAAINNSAWMTGKTGKNPYKFQGGPTDGFNTSVPSATSGTGMSSTTNGSATSSPSQTNNIYVTLQIQQANQQEAEAFAKTLKKYLEKDNKLQKIGSN